MSKTSNLLEFDLKIRKWASTTTEGITVLKSDNGNAAVFGGLFQLIEQRSIAAQQFLKSNDELDRKNILELIYYINKQIKQLLAL